MRNNSIRLCSRLQVNVSLHVRCTDFGVSAALEEAHLDAQPQHRLRSRLQINVSFACAQTSGCQPPWKKHIQMRNRRQRSRPPAPSHTMPRGCCAVCPCSNKPLRPLRHLRKTPVRCTDRTAVQAGETETTVRLMAMAMATAAGIVG